MLEALFLIAPGAFVYLISEKLTAGKERKWGSALIETIFYSGVLMGFMWLVNNLQDVDPETTASLGEMSGSLFWKSMLAALVLGILVSIVKKLDMEIRFVETGRSFMEKQKPWVRRLAGTLLFVCIAGASVTALFSGAISKRLELRELTSKKDYVKNVLIDLQKDMAKMVEDGKDPDSVDTVTIDGLEIQRVTSDQKWVSGSGRDKEEGVYIMDGMGQILYFSYRNKITAATWSGPTKDEEYIKKYGEWKGIGWSGPLMKIDS